MLVHAVGKELFKGLVDRPTVAFKVTGSRNTIFCPRCIVKQLRSNIDIVQGKLDLSLNNSESYMLKCFKL